MKSKAGKKQSSLNVVGRGTWQGSGEVERREGGWVDKAMHACRVDIPLASGLASGPVWVPS